MGPKRGGEGIVEHPDAFWRVDDVNVVEERPPHPGAECASRARRGVGLVHKRRALAGRLARPLHPGGRRGRPPPHRTTCRCWGWRETAGHRGGGAGAQGWRARHQASNVCCRFFCARTLYSTVTSTSYPAAGPTGVCEELVQVRQHRAQRSAAARGTWFQTPACAATATKPLCRSTRAASAAGRSVFGVAEARARTSRRRASAAHYMQYITTGFLMCWTSLRVCVRERKTHHACMCVRDCPLPPNGSFSFLLQPLAQAQDCDLFLSHSAVYCMEPAQLPYIPVRPGFPVCTSSVCWA